MSENHNNQFELLDKATEELKSAYLKLLENPNDPEYRNHIQKIKNVVKDQMTQVPANSRRFAELTDQISLVNNFETQYLQHLNQQQHAGEQNVNEELENEEDYIHPEYQEHTEETYNQLQQNLKPFDEEEYLQTVFFKKFPFFDENSPEYNPELIEKTQEVLQTLDSQYQAEGKDRSKLFYDHVESKLEPLITHHKAQNRQKMTFNNLFDKKINLGNKMDKGYQGSNYSQRNNNMGNKLADPLKDIINKKVRVPGKTNATSYDKEMHFINNIQPTIKRVDQGTMYLHSRRKNDNNIIFNNY